MLSKIRKNLRAFSFPLWIVAASFIGTIFLVWGKGSVSGPSGNEVATVNGEGITLTEFNREYQNTVTSLKKKLGDNFRKFVKEDDIKKITLNRLITRKLLLQLAEEEGLKVSDWAVAKYIEEIPAFQENGKFSLELYKKFLESRRMTPQTFEDMVREDLLIQKVLTAVNRAPSVSQFEIKELYRKVFGKRNFKYKLFLSKDFKPQVSQKEIEEFYKNNREIFKKGERESYYVLKFPKTKEGEERARKAYKLAKEGKFKELMEMKPQPLKDKELIEKVKEKGFSFRSQENGLELAFKLKEEQYKSLNEVRGEIERALREQKALEMAKKEAETFKGELNEETGKVDVSELVKKLKLLPTTNPEELLNAKVGKKLILPVEGGFAVLVPTTEPEVNEFEEDKLKRLKEFVLNVKRDSDYQNLLNLLRQKATIKVNQSLFRSVQ
ncbi:peptidyl-prolyl cis-trans isomerase D [Thermovibrio guaymasensis]|uniref:Peptidyl-prolyl cis-trans isomerase D n=1 Tax=Thermovibrio guaymasensis TaxID=240167 RepID=A0A420W6N7_9BACT|nr:peptidylprolyl isomerase [Thermovibrio guaymasensis]RKQ61745.1 peptidyl-prolyl cis-trans isomerase D [Thermovibrio guaymasensis]